MKSWLSSSTSVDLGVLQTDIRNQLEHSKDLLKYAEQLQAVVDKIEDQEAKSAVRQVIGALLASIHTVTSNVASTSATVSGNPITTTYTPFPIRKP